MQAGVGERRAGSGADGRDGLAVGLGTAEDAVGGGVAAGAAGPGEADRGEGQLVPIGLEVRPASLAGDGRGGWPGLPDEVAAGALPGTGFPLSLLRRFEWEERAAKVEPVVDRELGDLYQVGTEAVVQHLRRVTDLAVRRGMLRPGRRDLARSVFTLLEASVERTDGRPRSRGEIVAAVRGVYPDFDEAELRSTVQWARTHRPPLFAPYGSRQRGGRITRQTQLILILVDPLRSLEPDEREEIRRIRALDLQEFA